jgi:hypothetical protein
MTHCCTCNGTAAVDVVVAVTAELLRHFVMSSSHVCVMFKDIHIRTRDVQR